ncbi:response regulator [Bacillota bacterium Lsc_1132]
MKTVLLVDDSKFMRLWLTRILATADFSVIGEAGNGEEAIEKFKELRPDLVIMDLIMPHTDGFTVLKHILNLEPGAKVVICSSMGQQSMIKESLKIGAKGFIVKPHFKDVPSLLKKLFI